MVAQQASNLHLQALASHRAVVRAPASCSWTGKQRRMAQVLGPCAHMRDSEEAPGLDWSHFGCCIYLGSELADGGSLSVSPSLGKSAFQIK